MNTIKDEITRDHLISLVREREVLWDPRNCRYKDNKEIQKQWLEIAGIIGNHSAQKCQKTWRYLRDVYMGKKKKCPSGSAGGKKAVWVHMAAMSFINDVIKPRETTSNMPEYSEVSDGDDMENNPGIHTLPESQETILTPSFNFVDTEDSSPRHSAINRYQPLSVNSQQAGLESAGRNANVTSGASVAAEGTQNRAYSSNTPRPAYIIEEDILTPAFNDDDSEETDLILTVNSSPDSSISGSPPRDTLINKKSNFITSTSSDGPPKKKSHCARSPVSDGSGPPTKILSRTPMSNGPGTSRQKLSNTSVSPVTRPKGKGSLQRSTSPVMHRPEPSAVSTGRPLTTALPNSTNTAEGRKKKNQMSPFQQRILNELSVTEDSDMQWLNSLKPLLNRLPLLEKENAKIDIHSHLLKIVRQHLSGQEDSS